VTDYYYYYYYYYYYRPEARGSQRVRYHSLKFPRNFQKFLIYLKGSEENRSVANVQSNDLWSSRMHAATHILQEKTHACGVVKRHNFRVHVSIGSAETLVRRGGIINHHSIAYSVSNISAKNYRNRLIVG